jgi:hypothetical protein
VVVVVLYLVNKYKDGEELIRNSYPQLVVDPFTKEFLTIPEYKEKYKL